MKQVHARAMEKAAEVDAGNAGSGDGSAAAAIAASQRAWETYRDAECRDVVGRGGGSGRMVWVLSGGKDPRADPGAQGPVLSTVAQL